MKTIISPNTVPDFVSAIAGTLNHLVLFSDAAGEYEIKKSHDGENLDKVARILSRGGVFYTRYMRTLLIAYAQYVLKGKSTSVMAQAIQFFFGTTVRFTDMEALHVVGTMMRAELIMELDPKNQAELQLFVEAAGIEIFQYTLVNIIQLFNKQAPLTPQVLDTVVNGESGSWPYPEQNSGINYLYEAASFR